MYVLPRPTKIFEIVVRNNILNLLKKELYKINKENTKVGVTNVIYVKEDYNNI